MASSNLPDVLLEGDHASRPAATAVVAGALYACSDHGLVYQSDGSSWSTWATLGSSSTPDHNHTTTAGDGGDLDAPVIGDYAVFTEASAPSTPSSGLVAVYAKSDGRIYSKDDGGTEYGPFDAGGGSDPRDFPSAYTLDDLALGSGILFNEAAGVPTGMTALGTIASTDYAAMPGLDLLLDAGDHLYLADPGGDLEAMIHFSDTDDANGMFGIGFIDNSGNGHCFVQYQNNLYQMAAASNLYSGTGTNIGSQTIDATNTFAHQWIAVKRVGTTLTARMSRDGTSAGFSSATTGVTNSTSTRIAVGRWFGGNGGKKVRMHQLVIAAPNLGV